MARRLGEFNGAYLALRTRQRGRAPSRGAADCPPTGRECSSSWQLGIGSSRRSRRSHRPSATSTRGAPISLSAEAGGGQCSAHRPLVLVVEDNETDAYLVDKAVKQTEAAAEIIVAPDLLQARARLEACRDGLQALPDVVLVDLHLPSGSGLELVEWARSQPWLVGLRFVVVSHYADEATIRRACEAGVSSFISKAAIHEGGGVAKAAARYWLKINTPLSAT
jgi:CheY-like chemotaxis protein